MPQMFPSPMLFLLILVSILFLISMARVFWHLTFSYNSSGSVESGQQNKFVFVQTW